MSGARGKLRRRSSFWPAEQEVSGNSSACSDEEYLVQSNEVLGAFGINLGGLQK